MKNIFYHLDDEVEMFLYDDKFKEFTETKSIYEVKIKRLVFFMKINMY